MPELLRPEPQPDWRDRTAAVLAAIERRPVVAGVAALVAVLAVALLLRDGPEAELRLPVARPAPVSAGGPSAPGPGPVTAPDRSPAGVVVHVAGAVARPGVHRVPPGARVADAVAAAGGPLPGADPDQLNLAAPLDDGQRVWVPRQGEPPAAGDPAAAGAALSDGAGGRVDVNTADVAELEALPGIGPATAEAILEHRRRHGRFRSVDELLEVRGIGEAKLAALRPRVRV